MKSQDSLSQERVAAGYLQRFQSLIKEPQHTLPDVFIWMLAGGERTAYCRIPARDIVYSHNPLERGRRCGRLETFFLKIPGFEGLGSANLTIQCALRIYLWLGTKKLKHHFLDLMPEGFEHTNQIIQCMDAESGSKINPPRGLTYLPEGIQNFQFQAHIYQARNLLPSDSSGLSDPYGIICLNQEVLTTITVKEDLNPVYKQTLISDCFAIVGPAENVKDNSPTIVIELFDFDNMGDDEILGRIVCTPKVIYI